MQLSQRGPPTPGLQVHSLLLGLQRVLPPETTEPTGWQEQAAEERGDRTRGLHVNISVCKSKDVSLSGTGLEALRVHYEPACMQRTNTLVEAQTNTFGVYTVNSHGNMKG